MSRDIKVVVVGDNGVGKRTMLFSYTTNSFPTVYTPTVFDNYTAQIYLDGEMYFVNLFDISGQQDFDRLRPLSYVNTDIFLLCFSTISMQSLTNVQTRWFPEVRAHRPTAQCLLVGLKTDLRDDPEERDALLAQGSVVVYPEMAEEVARQLGIPYRECSALTQGGLKQVFDTAILHVLAAREQPIRRSATCCVIL